MKSLLLFLSLSCTLLFFACEDDLMDGPAPPLVESLMPLEVGNYWIYEQLSVNEETGEISNTDFDTLRVVDTEFINGQEYHKLEGPDEFMFLTMPNYLRDSSGFLVTEKNRIILAPELTDQIYRTDTTDALFFLAISHMTLGETVAVDVPVGSFQAVRNESFFAAEPVDMIRPDAQQYRDYAIGVGMVQSRTPYAAAPRHILWQLVEYGTE